MAGGGGSGGLGSFLPTALAIGASIAAPELAPAFLSESLGTTAAVGLTGAALGGGAAALTGGNVGQGALMGGLGGALTGSGILSGAGGSTPLNPNYAGPEMVDAMGSLPPTPPPIPETPFTLSGTEYQGLPGATPNPGIPTDAMGSLPPTQPSSQSIVDSMKPTISPAGSPAPSGWSSLSGLQKAGIIGAGGLAAVNILGQQPTLNIAQAANPVTSGLDYTFDRNTYQPSIAPNYNGIAGLNTGPAAQRLIGYGYGNPKTQNLSGYGYADGGSIGTVEEMSRENATGGNQMFPQSGLGGLTGANTYQNATNTPTSSNLMEPTDAVTDPYTGAMKFAAGGPAPTAQNMLNTMSQSTANAMQNGNSSGFNPIGSASNLISGNTSGSGSQGIDFANDPNYVFDQRTGQYVRRFKTGGKTPRTPTANAQQNTSLNLPEVKKHMAATRTPEGLKAVSTAAQGGDYNAQFALNQMQGSPVQGIDAASQMPATVQAAQGGIMGGTIGSYSDGGQMLKGPGDGMSDSIPAKIGKHQPARLADSEFVIPADVVSHLGNGSSDAGAKQLYAMMDRIRKARTGTKKQGKQIKPEKYMPA